MSYVNFNRQKDLAFASSANADPNTIYFTSDTNEIVILGKSYGSADLTGYATEQWVEELNYLTEHQDISNKVDVADFEEAARVTAEALNLFHRNTLWQTEDTYVRCDKSKTLEEAVSGESDIVYFTTDSHQIVLNGVVYNLLNSEDYATKQWVEDKGYLTEHLDISGKVDVTKFEETNHVVSTALNYLNDNKQDKTDTSLETENKTIVGAINEVNSKCGGSGADLSNYLPLTGGTMTGDINMKSSNILFDGGLSASICTVQDGIQIDTNGGSMIEIGQNILFSGNIVSSDSITATAFYETSDARKKDIKSDLSLDKCYELIDKCQTVIYSLKDQTKELVGMIAQEIEEFFPEVVATDEEGFKSLAYDRLVVICFKVLKDVIKRLEKLEQ